ncbi:hypothetical protein BASA81_003983 [Batrachochytrium salamandrivorans]|nr:hypothetical protein BASA81_003983 [Batrachochytrium salamandrivorans]
MWLLLVWGLLLLESRVAGEECFPSCAEFETCYGGICQPQTCFDSEWSQGETDVDCGGSGCALRCGDGQHCQEHQDCSSNECFAGKCLSVQCMDGILNGNESAVDCGGNECAGCAPGLDCNGDEDCLGIGCETWSRYICLESDCSRCGEREACPRCENGLECEHDAQCESDLCENGQCKRNDCETCGAGKHCPLCAAGEDCDLDEECFSQHCSTVTNKCLAETCDLSGKCGGVCDPCELGGRCNVDQDCRLGLKCDEEDSVCVPTWCSNGQLDEGKETDVDCGGNQCSARCPNLGKCREDSDCALDDDGGRGVCDLDAKRCLPASCVNRRQDGEETGVDCGGPDCLPCQKLGSGCLSNRDVDSALDLVCHQGVVVPKHCQDGQTNVDETDVDCGGQLCVAKCQPSQDCLADSDCESNDCYEGVCASQACHNLLKDGSETDVDCGGASCRPCVIAQQCQVDQDCGSGLCSEFHFKCQPPECTTKCGGGLCDPCPVNVACSSDSDCESGYCFGEGVNADHRTSRFVFPEAARGVCLASQCRLECGQGECPGCAAGQPCQVNSECASGQCDLDRGKCFAAYCFNGKLDREFESDVDCGGPFCPKCLDHLAHCRIDSDCISNQCGWENKCAPTTCANSRLDGLETDVDCGGGECDPCKHVGEDACVLSARDCVEGLLCSPTAQVCVDATCLNGIREVNESDIDCGPGCHSLCASGAQCQNGEDCQSGYCFAGECAPEHCKHECGLTGCSNKCLDGSECESHDQCLIHSRCLQSKCVDETKCRLDWKLAGATDPSGCGGLLCPQCGPHRLCQAKSDCRDGLVCHQHKCERETCFDGAMTLGEVCVDAGGVCKSRCKLGELCQTELDCERGLQCTQERCDEWSAGLPELQQNNQVEELVPPLPPPQSVNFVFDDQYISTTNQVLSGLLIEFQQLVLGFETAHRHQLELQVLRWAATAPGRTLDALCGEDCVLERAGGREEIQPHAFYTFRGEVDVPMWRHFQGWMLLPGSRVVFQAGVQIVRLSVVGPSSVLQLQGACDVQSGGVVVEQGAKLELLANTTLVGTKLVVLGELVIHANVVVDVAELLVFGRVTVLGHNVLVAVGHLDVMGSLVVQGGLLFRSGNVNVQEGGVLAVLGEMHVGTAALASIEGGLLYVSGELAVRGEGLRVKGGGALVYVAGKLAAESFEIHQGQVVVVGELDVSAKLWTSKDAGLVVLAKVSSHPAAQLELHSPVVYVVYPPVVVVGVAAATTPGGMPKLTVHGDLVVLGEKSLATVVMFDCQVNVVGRLLLPSNVVQVRFSQRVVLACGNDCVAFVVAAGSLPSPQRLSLVFQQPTIVTRVWRIPATVTVEFSAAVWFANEVTNLGSLQLAAMGLFSHTYSGKGRLINHGHIHVAGDAELGTSMVTKSAVSVGYLPLGPFSHQLFGLGGGATCATHNQTIMLILTQAVLVRIDFCACGGSVWNKLALMACVGLDPHIVVSKHQLGGGVLAANEAVPRIVYLTPTTSELEALLALDAKFQLEAHKTKADSSIIELVGRDVVFANVHFKVLERGKLLAAAHSRSSFRQHSSVEAHRGSKVQLASKSSVLFESKSTFRAVHSNITVGDSANLTMNHASLQVEHGSWENFGLMTFAHASNASLATRFFHNFGDMHAGMDSLLSFASSSPSDVYFMQDSILDSLGYLYVGRHTQVRFLSNSLLQASGEMVVDGQLEVETSFAYLDGALDVSGEVLVHSSGSVLKANYGARVTIAGRLVLRQGALFDFSGKQFLVTKSGLVKTHGAKCVLAGERVDVAGGSMHGQFHLRAKSTGLLANARVNLTEPSTVSGSKFLMTASAQLVVDAPVQVDAREFHTEAQSSLIITPQGVLQVVSGEFDVRGELENSGVLVLETPTLQRTKLNGGGNVLLRSPKVLEMSECGGGMQVHAGATLKLVGPMTCAYSSVPIEVKSGGTLALSGRVELFRDIKLARGAQIELQGGSDAVLVVGNGTTLTGPGLVLVSNSAAVLVKRGAFSDGIKVEVVNKAKLVLDGTLQVMGASQLHLAEASSLEIANKKHRLEIAADSQVVLSQSSTLESFGHVINDGLFVLESKSSALLYGNGGSQGSEGGAWLGTGRTRLLGESKLQLQGRGFVVQQQEMELGNHSALTLKSCEGCVVTSDLRLASGSKLNVEGRLGTGKFQGRELDLGPRSRLLINAQGNVTLAFQNRIVCQGGTVAVVNHHAGLTLLPSRRVEFARHCRLGIDAGQVWLHGTETRFAAQSTVQVATSAFLQVTGAVLVVERDAKFACMGECVISAGLVNAEAPLLVEGKLVVVAASHAAEFVAKAVLVQASGTLELRAESGSGGGGSGGEEEDAVVTIANLDSFGYVVVREYVTVAVTKVLRSSGDVFLSRFARLVVLGQATWERSFSTVKLEGELVVDQGAIARLFSNVKGVAQSRITIFGTLELHHNLEVDFLSEEEEGGGMVNVTSSGTLTGSVVLRNAHLVVSGRAEFAHSNAAHGGGGALSIVGGNFELLPHGVLEANVFVHQNQEVSCDVVDVKQGTVRLSPKAIVSLAVVLLLDDGAATGEPGKRLDVAPVIADSGKLVWQRGSLRVAAFPFANTQVQYSAHVYEVDAAKTSSLHIRVEQTASTASSVTLRALGSVKTYTLRMVGELQLGWETAVQRYLGGTPSLSGGVVSVPCYEDVECRVFCALLHFAKPQLLAGLGVAEVSSPECDEEGGDSGQAWKKPLLPCVADGKRGTASAGERCDFPFDHLGVTYSRCAQDVAQGEWCLTEQGNWGACVCELKAQAIVATINSATTSKRQSTECWTNGMGPAQADEPCVFPFFESRELGHQAYYACIGNGLGGQGFCRTLRGDVGGCDCRKPPATKTTEHNHHCLTNGRGAAPAGKRCVFPFVWRNTSYSHCVGSSWGSGEGFCLTQQGQRGGCACDYRPHPTAREGGSDEGEEEGVYFLHGPSMHTKADNVVEILATMNKPHTKWYVFAVAGGSPVPQIMGNLKDATGFSFTNTLVLKHVAWGELLDLYFYVSGFDREDVLANALLGVKLKPPSASSQLPRFTVSPPLLTLVEGQTGEIILEANNGGGNGAIDVAIETSQSHQVRVLQASGGGVKLEGKLVKVTIQALEDGVAEGQHSVLIYFIDRDLVATAGVVEIFLRDQGGGGGATPRQGLVFDFPDSEEVQEGEDGIMVLPTSKSRREYYIRLSGPPHSPVLVELHDVKNVLHLSSPLVFGRMDWDQGQLVSLHSASKEALIRHRSSSADARFVDVDRFVRVAGDSVPPVVPSNSLPPLPLLEQVYLFPQSSAKLDLDRNSNKVLVGDSRVRFHPPTAMDGAVLVWVETDPGYSFSTLVSVGDSAVAVVHYVSRIPAVVLSKSQVADLGQAYFVSLSLPVPFGKQVKVTISTDTDSVCMDLHAEWKRPCSTSCHTCLTHRPELVVEPSEVVFTSTKAAPVEVNVVGWTHRPDVYYQGQPGSLFLIHRVVVTASSSSSSLEEKDGDEFGRDMPTVFGPFDTPVRGLEVVVAANSPLPPPPAIVLVPAKRQYLVGLNYFARAQVEIQSKECAPMAVIIPALTLTQVKVHCPSDQVVYFTSRSEDAWFDGLRLEYASNATGQSLLQRSWWLRAGLNLVAALCTLVAVLFVWVQVGPYTIRRQRHRPAAAFNKSPGTTEDSQQQLALAFASGTNRDLHEFDLVVVELLSNGEYCYKRGRLFGDEDVFMRSWAVGFLCDGDADFEVDSQSIRRHVLPPLGDGEEEQDEVVLQRSADDEDFGLHIGWTSLGRAVLVGFIPLSPAFLHPRLQQGDVVLGVNSRLDFTKLEQVLGEIQSTPAGGKLKLLLRRRRM